MGMAASQVRFLSLQNRKNTIGRQLSTLSNRKISLSRDMKNVSRNYTDALNQIHLKWSNDSGANYHNLTYDMLMKPNEVNASVPYILTNANNGKVILNNSALYTPDTMFDDNPEALTAQEDIRIGGTTIAKAGEDISYITLAKMISSFKSVNDTGKPVYDTTGAYTTTAEGNLVGQAGVAKGYYIPDTVDFNFKNNLRYELFKILGLVTDEQVKTQNSMLAELYGSEEAKNTGVYPIGSAWGDYYLAQANLEAYEAYLDDKQRVATGNYADGSKKNNATYNDTTIDGAYIYKTDVNGKFGDGSSTCNQTSIKGAIEHIDFKSAVDKGADGYYEVKDSNSVDLSGYNGAQIGDVTGTEYSTTVSSTGLTHTYKTDDILANALSNYVAANDLSSVDDGEWALKDTFTSNNVAKILNNIANNSSAETSFFIQAGGGHNYNESHVKDKIGKITDAYFNILQNNTIIDLKNPEATSAHEKAKTATINYLNNNRYGGGLKGCGHTSAPSQGAAKNDARNHGLSYAYTRAGWFHGSHDATAIDVKVAFNIYTSFFNYFYNNPTSTPDTINVNTNKSTITTGDDETAIKENSSKTISGKTYGESSYKATNTTAPSSGTKAPTVYTFTRDQMTTNSAEAESGATALELKNGQFVEWSTSSATKYYVKKNSSEELNYFSTGAETGYTSQKMRINDTTEKDVFGTITTSSGTYYLTNSSAIDAYKNGGLTSMNASHYVYIANSTTSSDASKVVLSNGTNGDVIITNSLSSSYYDIKFDSKVNEDTIYHEKLKQAVVKAKQKIDDLEDELENFYGDSDKKIMDYYDALFLRISEQGWEEDNYTKNDLYLNNKIQNNDFFLTECLQKSSNTGFNYTAKQATNVIKIFTVHDDDAENQALAEYEAKKSEIQYKENVIDTRMAKLETEQESINTEMEGIKKVRDDNTQTYFKIFA